MQIAELEELLNSRIIAAYTDGMSVVEIQRAVRMNRIEYVHGLLRETGHIQPMARSDYRRTYDIDFRLGEALRRMGYSFGRWSLGWRLEPAAAAVDLKTKPDDGEKSRAHQAVKGDFPEVFCKMFGGPPPGRRQKPESPLSRPSVTLTWDESRDGYVARIVEYPAVEEVGVDWEHAVERLRTAYHLFGKISRLSRAMDLKSAE